MILSEQNLVLELRKAFDKANNRIWIAVPFIGSWNSVEKIIGLNWFAKENLDIRLITDIRNEKFIDPKTFLKLKQQAKIKTLIGLHAKIYIIDDFMLLTSANLTGTAFSKRYEIGINLNNNEDVVNTFLKWWNIAESIDYDWTPSNESLNKEEPGENSISGLKILWKLPKGSINTNDFKEYFNTINYYKNFTKLYEKHAERQLTDLPIYQEIDSFFNYLFHEHPEKPSSKYLNLKNRILTKKERKSEFKKYFKQYKNWLKNNPNFEKYRLPNINTFQEKLAKDKIDLIKKNEIETLVRKLHCMNSLPINRARFLNPKNNKRKTIIKEWKELLYNKDVNLIERMQRCKNNLHSFGKSSICEFISWHNPILYPMINRNSNSGMKFFGYEIEKY